MMWMQRHHLIPLANKKRCTTCLALSLPTTRTCAASSQTTDSRAILSARCVQRQVPVGATSKSLTAPLPLLPPSDRTFRSAALWRSATTRRPSAWSPSPSSSRRSFATSTSTRPGRWSATAGPRLRRRSRRRGGCCLYAQPLKRGRVDGLGWPCRSRARNFNAATLSPPHNAPHTPPSAPTGPYLQRVAHSHLPNKRRPRLRQLRSLTSRTPNHIFI